MAPQKFASMRLKSRPTLVPFKDDASLIALRYEKTVQAEPPIPILTRLPQRSHSCSTRRTSTSASSSTFSSPPSSPVVVAPPPAIDQHPAFRSRAAARNTTVNDWKRDSGLAPTASSSATIAEEDCEDEESRACAKIAALEANTVVVVKTEQPVTPSVCESTSVDELVLSKQISGRWSAPCISKEVDSMDHYQNVQVEIAVAERKKSGSLSSTLSVDSPVELRDKSLGDLSPASAPIISHSRSSFAASDDSPNFSPVNIHEGFQLLSKDASYFSPISVSIPTDNLLEDDFLTTLSFSNRGSLMFGGLRAFPAQTTDGTIDGQSQTDKAHAPPPNPPADAPASAPILHIQYEEPPQSTAASTTETSANHLNATDTTTTEATTAETTTTDATTAETTAESASQATMTTPSICVLSADVEMESRKVRSLYESGEGLRWEDGARPSDVGERLNSTAETPTEEVENDPYGFLLPGLVPNQYANVCRLCSVAELQPPVWGTPRSGSSYSQRPETRSEYEVAGGLEDWEDLEGYDIDRYGFISPRKPEKSNGTPAEPRSSQSAPRRKHVFSKRDAFGLGLPSRGPSRKVSARSLNTQGSKASVASRRSTRSAIRQAGNLLPHNRDRRWMDEAGEMLSLSLGDEEKVEKISEAIKKKEWERSEKWRKMAKIVKKGKDGEGMEFDFDVKNQKLIDRTWKGIPDRWRASAWYSFMATSARAHKDSPSEDSIITDFHRLQCRGSPDDVQIDLDVPRTISRHVMFRKRYRGGQRLLFRVLHALSLYFPNTGYVQGMASLAATLLCYFDEEKCFVMLVRMWQLRGLEKLYSPGFDGLMAALNDFQTKWLDGKDVAKKLTELCIDPTAYGTRWYLTLFNLSIPFAAQLRVWDVFLLLGENPTDSPKVPESPVTMNGIDILHSTSAALIHALRDVLLDSDFENAMKALTSWIPVKDEDILMKVTRAEWKARQKRK
ncbi:TBC domain-containing protein [Colletotrichum fioriniae PJ7]|uniref:TBC domain-containing protein n=1 Tax=Colletotrichum fioriniae PJ7 TaxID=1445577 RepID=A0A010Q120_9PEZI|nr:TBC domain-containing protein [Colletotrichum fioriniae PJ7]